MGIFSAILLVVFIISAILLVLVVLVQDEQGEGLGGIFGGGSSAPIGNRSGNILTRTTSILGAIFLLASFGLAWLNRTPESGNVEAAARKLEATKSGQVEWWKAPAPAAGTATSAGTTSGTANGTAPEGTAAGGATSSAAQSGGSDGSTTGNATGSTGGAAPGGSTGGSPAGGSTQ